MRIAVMGTGGVGGYFGARLAAAGHDVAFIARGAHLAAIRERGLRVESVKGDVDVAPARATDRPEDVGPVDWVICAVKAWQVPEAARSIRPLVGRSTSVLPLQNGVEAAGQLAEVLGADRVVGGAAWIAASIVAPGVVRHAGIEPRVAVGEPGGPPSARVHAIRDAFLEAGVEAEAVADVRAVIWTKFLFISAVSGVGGVTRAPAGETRAVAETRALLVSAMAETAAVGRAHGVALAADVVEKTMAFVDAMPAATTASMQRDVVAGRPSELEAQSGAIVRLGRAVGVPTPTHAFLYAALLPQERRARGG
jgi:2-dehydropantoate 2-reductase